MVVHILLPEHVRDDAPNGRTVDTQGRLTGERRSVFEADQMIDHIDEGHATEAVGVNDRPFARAYDALAVVDDRQSLVLEYDDRRVIVCLPEVCGQPLSRKASDARPGHPVSLIRARAGVWSGWIFRINWLGSVSIYFR